MRKILGITMGDPAGVGPEITVKALQDPKVYESCKPLVVGDAAILERACRFVGAKCTIHPVADPSEGLYEHGIIDILDLGLLKPEDFAIGQVSAAAGDAAFRYVRKVIELAMDGKVDATVTNPLNKEAMNLAGHHFSGHTEIYAHYTGTEHYTMMLAHNDLRVVHVSTHVSLREACDRVKKERVLEVIEIANKACKDMGIENPRIAVAGLNPHCGENGLFGREEIEEITPAIEAAKAEGITGVVGPCPPDSVFSQAIGGWYDIVVCMYHDQGHIPLKTVGFVYDREKQEWKAVEGVNVTLGLPIIRASVDHGTDFYHAGKGNGNEISLEQIALWNPDLIVFQADSIYDTVDDDPAWAGIAAIDSGNYYQVPNVPYCWLNNPPTVNQLMGLQWLPRLLYPDAFDDSIEDVTRAYFHTMYHYDLTDAELADLLKDATGKA